MRSFLGRPLFSILRALGLRTEREFQRELASAARRAQEERQVLQQINEDLEEFAAAASHDLRAPLRAIRNAVSWLAEDLSHLTLSDELNENLRLLKSRAARMETLLNALLEYARAGRVAFAPELFLTKDIVDDVVFLLGDRAQSVVVVAGDLPEMFAPRVPLQQVLFNLIWNAMKHGGDDPALRVVVSAREEGSFQIFDVSDNGPGILPEFFERIFEIFRTLRSRDEVEGAGMGLALVKKLVERHGGQITVQSDIGKGTTFSFSWPKGAEVSSAH